MGFSFLIVKRVRLPLKQLKFKTRVTHGLENLRGISSRSISSGSDLHVWQDVLDYWFQPGEEIKWFQGGPQVDKEILEKFGAMVDKAIKGEFKKWEEEPKSSLALILLTDQFTRSIFRNTPEAFFGDARAKSIARKFIEGKTHNHLEFSCSERAFIYLPFEHSEDIEDQELSVKLFSKLVDEFKSTEDHERTRLYLEYAKRHKEVIEMFGRFPQRNKALRRENTSKEERFLKNIPNHYNW